jgi:hypothetical protein
MQLAQIEAGMVVNVIEVEAGLIPDWALGWPVLTGAAGIGWTWDGQAFAPPQPPVPEPLTIEACRAAVQAHVDAVAVSRLYDSGVSLASYLGSTNPAWAAEAAAFVGWRDAVWTRVHALWVEAPDDLTPEDVIAALPEITWP